MVSSAGVDCGRRADTEVISAARKGGQGEGFGWSMRIVARSNDPVRLGWLAALLADAGIEALVLDAHMSVLEGSIGAIPRRLVVAEADADRAEAVLRDAGEP